MAIETGDVKEVDGVIYTAVDSTNLKAVSIADTSHDTSIDVEVWPMGYLFEPTRKLFGGTSWKAMSAKLKKEIFDEADARRAAAKKKIETDRAALSRKN